MQQSTVRGRVEGVGRGVEGREEEAGSEPVGARGGRVGGGLAEEAARRRPVGGGGGVHRHGEEGGERRPESG